MKVATLQVHFGARYITQEGKGVGKRCTYFQTTHYTPLPCGLQKPEAQSVVHCKGSSPAHSLSQQKFALLAEAQNDLSLRFMEKHHGRERKGTQTMEKHKYL